MAAEKKTEKERSVEERLKALYQLQTILSEIDRIKTLRGELPNEVKDLEDEIIRFETRIEKLKAEIALDDEAINARRGEIGVREVNVAKYEEQIKNISNNREYSYLIKELEFERLEIELAQKKMHEAEDAKAFRQQKIEEAEEELRVNRQILTEKRQELSDIITETRQQEDDLRQQAQQLEPLIDDYTLAAFKRIRKNARNGLGIVAVQRDACGGCFNRIPPQRQLEVKMHKKIIVCEYCGRIIVDPQLAGIEEIKEAPVAKPKRKSAKKAKETPAAE